MSLSFRHFLILSFVSLTFNLWAQVNNDRIYGKYIYHPNNLYIDKCVLSIHQDNKFTWETFYNQKSERTKAKYMISKGVYRLYNDTLIFEIKKTLFYVYKNNDEEKITKTTNHKKVTKKAEYQNKTITFTIDSLKIEKYIKEP